MDVFFMYMVVMFCLFCCSCHVLLPVVRFHRKGIGCITYSQSCHVLFWVVITAIVVMFCCVLSGFCDECILSVHGCHVLSLLL